MLLTTDPSLLPTDPFLQPHSSLRWDLTLLAAVIAAVDSDQTYLSLTVYSLYCSLLLVFCFCFVLLVLGTFSRTSNSLDKYSHHTTTCPACQNIPTVAGLRWAGVGEVLQRGDTAKRKAMGTVTFWGYVEEAHLKCLRG